MSNQSDRIISLLTRQSEHPARNTILFVTGWVVLILVGAVLMLAIVFPRVQGYVTIVAPDDSMSATFSKSDMLMFQKVRQKGAQNLRPGNIIAFQPDAKNPVYKLGRVSELIGTGKEEQFTVKYDNGQVENQPVTLDMVRGVLVYKVPLLGAINHWTSQAFKSFFLVAISQLLLIYAGWQIGTSMINARDPQRQARAARLRTAALAGNLETTRQRLRRQGLR